MGVNLLFETFMTNPSLTPIKRTSIWRHLRHGFYLSVVLLVILSGYYIGIVYYYAQSRPIHQADAAIVLGAAAWGKNPSPVYKERLNHAISLYQNDLVKTLIFTGGTPKEGYPTEAQVGERYALKKGVARKDILSENTSRDTYQNLINAKKVAQQENIESIILVSDPYHMARAKFMAEDLDMQVQVSPTTTTRFSQFKQQIKFLLQESYLLFMYQWGKFFA